MQVEIIEGEGQGWKGGLDEFLAANESLIERSTEIWRALVEAGEFSEVEQWGRWTIRRCS